MTNHFPEISFITTELAFYQAIAAGRLSSDRDAPNFAGLFMYMGHKDGLGLFKNIETRAYLSAKV